MIAGRWLYVWHGFVAVHVALTCGFVIWSATYVRESWALAAALWWVWLLRDTWIELPRQPS